MVQVKRRKTKVIKIGGLCIGGDNPIAIQSMAKTKTADIEKAAREILLLEDAGCEIVRLAIKDSRDAKALKKIKQKVSIPIVADIHFNYHLALEAIDSGADKIRLNPGNIFRREEVRQIAAAAKLNRIPIRAGLNSGSVLGVGGGKSMAARLVKSALDYVKILEGFKFYDIVLSLKASNVMDTLDASRRISKLCDYPLHLGVTATGLALAGAVKSSIAIGILLSEGIGDTIRVSLTDSALQEVKVARYILESLGLRHFGLEIISCPTCGRCEVDLVKLVREFENKMGTVNCQLSTVNSRPLRVAIMGCVVNGPGEAKEADIGIAFGKKEGLLFKHGLPLKKVSPAACVKALLKEVKNIGELNG